jgi:hypothetical protein
MFDLSLACRVWAFSLFLCGAAPAAVPRVPLVPQPQSLKVEEGTLAWRTGVKVFLTSRTQASRFAYDLLAQELRQDGIAAEITAEPGAASIVMGVAGEPRIDAEVRRRSLDRAALERTDGYLLDSRGAAVLIAGGNEAGLFYGVETLLQALRPSRDGVEVPRVDIADWAALRYRGLSIDISRGPVLTEQQLMSVIRNLAEYKMNMLGLYMEHVFPFRSSPLAAPEGTGITAESMQRLGAYAKQYHVDLVPEQQTFGHLHQLLKLEMYADMAETPHGSVLAVESEAGYRWISGAAAELARAFPSRFLNIGGDETFELGQGRTQEMAARVGVGGAYLEHMRRVTSLLAPLDRRLMFWGDMALAYPEMLPRLPKSLVAMTWSYDAKDDFSAEIEPFRSHGMDFFVCPGLNNWSGIYPDVRTAMANIDGFVRDGKRLGALGMLNTHWNDDGDALFNLNWFGIVFSAAAAWQEGGVDAGEFRKSFDWAFHRGDAPTVAGVVERFAEAEALLRKAGVSGGSAKLFWIDPFSPAGARRVQAASQVASQVRVLAEQNLTDLMALAAGPVRHAETLRYLALAARRLDYAGMKVQYAQQMVERYRDALANLGDTARVRRDLRRISSATGFVDDLRAAILDLKGRFRDAWLAESQPYWMENVLIRYDAEALYWQQKSRAVGETLLEYQATKKLPADVGQALSPGNPDTGR